MAQRPCPACGSQSALTAGSIAAGRIVAGNGTYRPDALARLGVDSAAEYELSACADCGFLFAPAVPDDAFLRVLYDEVIDPPKASFESQSPGWVAHQLRLAALILERFTDAREVHLLDYGCGYGTLVRTLNGPRVHCKGYEPSPSVVTRVREAGLDVTASLAEVEETAPFDGIILSDVLEHVPEPRAVLAKCRSLLKPGGWLVANVPDFAERRASAILDDLRRGLPAPPDLNPWEHLNYYTPASLARIVESAGFRVDPAANADFGFRPGERGRRAWLNAVKSALRVVRFLRRPQATTTTILASRT